MTTLFSVFAPVYTLFSIKSSVVLLSLLAICLWVSLYLVYTSVFSSAWLSRLSLMVFPNIFSFNVILFSLFMSLSLLNLFSLMVYSYPITTTLGFNLSAAVSCWFGGILIQVMKYKSLSSLLPANSPWYLVPFLCVVELISVMVRPITLCFRLLANMVAGHVLISLICKIPAVWSIGSLFGVLELMVALVQGFVFSMLIMVYLEEAFSH